MQCVQKSAFITMLLVYGLYNLHDIMAKQEAGIIMLQHGEGI